MSFKPLLFFILCKISIAFSLSYQPEEVREKINHSIMQTKGMQLPVDAIEEHAKYRLYISNKSNDVICLIHGGAWVAGNIETHDNLARYLNAKTQANVVSIEYTTAPEGRFPNILEECYEVLTSLGKYRKIIVVGDSAGGNMAAAVCLMAYQRGGPKVDFLALINPAPDLRCNGTLEPQDDELDFQRWQARQYLTHNEQANNPLASPIISNELDKLPRVLITLCSDDLLYNDGKQFANAIRDMGGDVILYTQEKTNHLAGNAARVSQLALPTLEKVTMECKKCISE